MTSYDVVPIGVVVSGRVDLIEDHWDHVVTTLELDEAVVGVDATVGLADFSHAEIVFGFHLSTKTRTGLAHPRGNAAWPQVGALSDRGPHRHNHLGVTVCRLIEIDGLRVTVRGLDAIVGSPIFDVKPYSPELLPRGEVHGPRWMTELMRDYYDRVRTSCLRHCSVLIVCDAWRDLTAARR
jgi:tRNA (Thr-GGU) A37 N-methylase